MFCRCIFSRQTKEDAKKHQNQLHQNKLSLVSSSRGLSSRQGKLLVVSASHCNLLTRAKLPSFIPSRDSGFLWLLIVKSFTLRRGGFGARNAERRSRRFFAQRNHGGVISVINVTCVTSVLRRQYRQRI